jgi:5-amino-6-(5-phosphoribosylamino)uracil reductase
VNSAERRTARTVAAKPAYPLKVTLTASGGLDPGLTFWRHGDRKVVYTVDDTAPKLRAALDGLAEVVSTGAGTTVDLGAVLDDLGARGVRRLMVEGGSSVHTQFLAQGLADEVHLAVAPLLVGDLGAPRFLNPAAYPGGSSHRLTLLEARTVGDVVLLRYAPKPAAREASA